MSYTQFAGHIEKYVYIGDVLETEKYITRVEFAVLLVKSLGIQKEIGQLTFDDVLNTEV